ncbi:nitrilase/cyanide hydratase and apolipoprotein N-acyltransferase [Caballeronia choica]|uniref:Nitrilase/cyanide hydratase and apolipoprotein N-acyltransferase n=2 Tax=Caballeronia choica TaxID=326476 RepID=A0A158JU33_9BURK|nr:nitrilase/cyanide hydratase and apolipoprotein N-acyltransferase [Caballeronia choica]
MMMTAPRIRLIQSTLVDGDIGRNLDCALQTIAAARGETDLVVFSETYVSGFPTPANVARLAEPLDGPSISAVRAAAKEAGVSVVIGFAENDGGRFYNTAVLIDESGAVLLKYRKTHLYESDEGVFERGDAFPVCDWHGVRVGLLICFDLEFPETARMLARNGAELIVIADGMMNPYGHVHRRMIPVRAMENQVAVVMANRVGEGERYTFCGQSQAVDPDGERIAIADAAREDVLDVTLDLEAVARAREAFRYVDLAALAPVPARHA